MSSSTMDHANQTRHDAGTSSAGSAHAPVLVRFPNLTPAAHSQPTACENWWTRLQRQVLQLLKAAQVQGQLSTKPGEAPSFSAELTLNAPTPASLGSKHDGAAEDSADGKVSATFALSGNPFGQNASANAWNFLGKAHVSIVGGGVATAAVALWLVLGGGDVPEATLADKEPLVEIGEAMPTSAPLPTTVSPTTADGDTPPPTEVNAPPEIDLAGPAPSWNPHRGLPTNTQTADAWPNRGGEIAREPAAPSSVARTPYTSSYAGSAPSASPASGPTAAPGVARLQGRIEDLIPTVGTRYDAHRSGLH